MLQTSASFSLFTAIHLTDERLLILVVGRSDLEESADRIADIFGNIGSGFYDFCCGARRLFRLLLHRSWCWSRGLSLAVFVPVESLADGLVCTSAVSVNLRCLELLPIFDVRKTFDFGRPSSEFLPDGDVFLSQVTLKGSLVFCFTLGGLNGEINLLTSLGATF